MPRATRQARPRLDPESLATRLHSAAIHLLRRLRTQDAAMGLTGPRASALSVIVFGGPVSLGDLARAEQVRPPTMSRIVASLAEAGLVEQAQDPDDKRAYRLRATAKGKAVLEAGRARRVRVLTTDLQHLPAPEYEKMAAAIETFEQLARRPDRGD